jgi:hypothetical protein
VGTLDLSVQLRRSWFDVDMFHPLVCYMPMKERLELVATVGSDRLDPERELVDDVVDEADCVGLCVTLVDLQCAYPRRIIDRGVLIPPYRPAPFLL